MPARDHSRRPIERCSGCDATPCTCLLFETPSDALGWFNTACTRIALVMLAWIAAITLVAEIVR